MVPLYTTQDSFATPLTARCVIPTASVTDCTLKINTNFENRTPFETTMEIKYVSLTKET